MAWLAWIAVGCSDPTHPPALELYVADLEAQTVWVLDQDGALLDDRVALHDLPEWAAPDGFKPSAVAVDGLDLLVANSDGGEVFRFDRRDGAWLGLVHDNGWGGPRLEEPCALAMVGGDLLALGNDTRNLLRLSPAPGELDASLRSAHSLSVDGDLTWVGSSPSIRGMGLLQAWDLDSGEQVRELAPWPELESATGLLAQNEQLYVVDWFAGELAVLDAHSGARLETRMGPDQLQSPVAVAAHGEALYVLETQGLWLLEPGEPDRQIAVPQLAYARNLAVAPAP